MLPFHACSFLSHHSDRCVVDTQVIPILYPDDTREIPTWYPTRNQQESCITRPCRLPEKSDQTAKWEKEERLIPQWYGDDTVAYTRLILMWYLGGCLKSGQDQAAWAFLRGREWELWRWMELGRSAGAVRPRRRCWFCWRRESGTRGKRHAMARLLCPPALVSEPSCVRLSVSSTNTHASPGASPFASQIAPAFSRASRIPHRLGWLFIPLAPPVNILAGFKVFWNFYYENSSSE